MVALASAWEAMAGRPGVQGPPGLGSQSEARLDYTDIAVNKQQQIQQQQIYLNNFKVLKGQTILLIEIVIRLNPDRCVLLQSSTHISLYFSKTGKKYNIIGFLNTTFQTF